MSFQLADIPSSHFQQLDQFFGQGSHLSGFTETSQRIQHPHVEGRATEWYFDGIRMGYSDWKYRKAVDLPWRYDIQVDLITLQVNLRGSVFMGPHSAQAPRLFTGAQHNLFYANGHDRNEGFLRSDRLRSSLFFLQFSRDSFLRMAAQANEPLQRFCDRVLSGQSTLLSSSNLPVDTPMLGIIQQINHCPYTGGLKHLFLLSKSIELLVLQAAACADKETIVYQYLQSASDIDAIVAAREHIMSHLDDPPSLAALARIVGINEYKLKRGFKEVYGNTVFGYLAEARLELARTQLLHTHQAVAAIAVSLGYASPQHFSKAFSRKFGLSPQQWRRQSAVRP
ncbi:helix-turn-helix domain-containing protein [Paraflavitalea pollutisoli]|uniref:helix-turn-helix domain-containing protein n=1 Tax=Paraflavitalea pollutisoli TaxID=3034143 RepID=UPI0023EAA393|nr:AraC family transcriptional regulator [Paraflavitalea sp. H1-2-19X]